MGRAAPADATPPSAVTSHDRLTLAARITGLVAVVLLQIIWERQSLPPLVRLFHVALVGLSVWRPEAGLLALAGLGPLAGDVWRVLGGPGGDVDRLLAQVHAGTPLLQQMVLTVLTGWIVRWQPDTTRQRLPVPVSVLAVVTLASAVTVLPARVFAATPDLGVLGVVGQLWSGKDLTTQPEWRPLFFALYTVEGLTLACMAERLVRRVPTLVPRIMSLVLAALAVVALLTIASAMKEAMGAADGLSAVRKLLAEARMSRYTDPNATASVFVLVTLASVALFRRSASRMALACVALLLVLAGLWLSGSRTALASLVVTVLAVLSGLGLESIRTTRRQRLLVLTAGVGVVAISALAILFYPGKRNDALRFTVTSRWIVTQAALRMTATSPFLGVGVGTFWDRSTDFGMSALPELARARGLWWPEAHENAHNNFLQVLAEEGVLGLLAFCWVLGTVMVPSWRARATLSSAQFWILAGLFGFMLTWLTGHPLLVPEAAFVFWLLFGVATGLTAPPEKRGTSWWAWLAVGLAVSVPFRLMQEAKAADFSHVGLHLSAWQHDDDGIAYRAAGAAFSLYVPSNRTVQVPLRLAPGAPDALHVEFRVDGRLVNSIVLTGRSWKTLTLQVPSKGRRFVRVDFALTADGSQAAPASCVQVGQDEAH